LTYALKHDIGVNMAFKNEDKFRRQLIKEIGAHLGNDWMVLCGKNVSDVVLCFNNPGYTLDTIC
jgi:hypothetical protein